MTRGYLRLSQLHDSKLVHVDPELSRAKMSLVLNIWAEPHFALTIHEARMAIKVVSEANIFLLTLTSKLLRSCHAIGHWRLCSRLFL